MNIISSYSKAVKEHSGAFEASVRIYRAAVDFFIGIIDSEWWSRPPPGGRSRMTSQRRTGASSRCPAT